MRQVLEDFLVFLQYSPKARNAVLAAIFVPLLILFVGALLVPSVDPNDTYAVMAYPVLRGYGYAVLGIAFVSAVWFCRNARQVYVRERDQLSRA
jgi:hypothetical protein